MNNFLPSAPSLSLLISNNKKFFFGYEKDEKYFILKINTYCDIYQFINYCINLPTLSLLISEYNSILNEENFSKLNHLLSYTEDIIKLNINEIYSNYMNNESIIDRIEKYNKEKNLNTSFFTEDDIIDRELNKESINLYTEINFNITIKFFCIYFEIYNYFFDSLNNNSNLFGELYVLDKKDKDELFNDLRIFFFLLKNEKLTLIKNIKKDISFLFNYFNY